jgi:YVTN family beta-propeller protein
LERIASRTRIRRIVVVLSKARDGAAEAHGERPALTTLRGVIMTFQPRYFASAALAGLCLALASLTGCNVAGSLPNPVAPATLAARPSAGHHLYVSFGGGSIWTYTLLGKTVGSPITGNLDDPTRLAIDGDKLVVPNYVGNSVTTYLLNGTETTPTIRTGVSGPVAVAVSKAGEIYVSDQNAKWITAYSPSGKRSTTLKIHGYPGGVAVDSHGKLYVVDETSVSVRTFTSDLKPTTPTITKGLDDPRGIAVGSDGKIYVTNYANNTVTVYNAKGKQISPTIATGLNEPLSIALGTSGDIYVVNSGSSEITSYNAKGQQIKPTITNTGGAGGIAFK